jgi:DNA-binding HxlR family transcriptional regulator
LDEIEDIFRKFRDESTRFSKDLSQVLYATSRSTRDAAANLNLVLAKTIFSKWSIEILTILYGTRAAGFGEIKKRLGLISSRVLSQKLKKLEAIGLVQRTVINARPPRVMYALTEKGLTVAKLGEPVFLYIGYIEGMYMPPKVVVEKDITYDDR